MNIVTNSNTNSIFKILLLSLLFTFRFDAFSQIASQENDIISYTITGQSESTVIDTVNYTVTVSFAPGTDLTNLVATFTLSAGATAEVGEVIQVSDSSAHDFTLPVEYVVRAEDQVTTQDWMVYARIVYPEMGLTSYSPQENSIVSSSTNISLTLSDTVNLSTAATGIRVAGSYSGLISGSWSASGNTITFDPTNNFYPGEVVTVTMTHGLENDSGTIYGLPYSWEFNVESGVSSQSPAIFGSNQIIDLGTTQSPWMLGSGDLDQDGDIDLLATDYSKKEIYWYSNDGTGSFTKSVVYSGSTYANDIYGVNLGDIDNDGDNDLVAYRQYALVWFENDGAESFTPHNIPDNLGSGVTNSSLGDFDNDGNLDIVISSYYGDHIYWYQNDGLGNFHETMIATGLDNLNCVEVADLDLDGDVDIVSGTQGSRLDWFENDGSGVFTTHSISTSSYSPRSLSSGDIDGDGDVDLLTTGNRLMWWENDGQGGFTGHQVSTLNVGFSVTGADIDGDGDYDIVTIDSNTDRVLWYENDGSGNFTEYVIPTPADYPRFVTVADLDGDGDIDIASSSDGDDKIAWYPNIGSPITDANDILSFSLPGQVGASDIDTASHSVVLNYMSGTDLSNLIATFEISLGATTDISGTPQVSGTTANDFTSPVIYTVTAGDGTTMQDWTVTAHIMSSETGILAFSLENQAGSSVMDTVANTITSSFYTGADVTSLTATFTLSTGATATVSSVVQESGVTLNDYTLPVVYTVLSEDSTTTQDWTVNTYFLSNETDVLTYSLPGQTSSNIDTATHTITIGMPEFVDLINLIATFTISGNATVSVGGVAQQSGVTANDFSTSVVYVITAEDSVTTQDWTVNIQTLSSTAAITDFNIPGALNPGAIDTTNYTISIDFMTGTDVSALVASFTASAGSTVSVSGQEQASGMSVNNFSSPLVYTVLAEDQTTSADWTVTVNFVSLCDLLAGLGLECDAESRLAVQATIAGEGLTWDDGILSVTDNANFNLAYNERGSVIGGTGLNWNGAQLDIDGGNLAGLGLAWTGSSFEFDPTNIISDDFEWDPVAKELSLKDSVVSLFTKVDDSSIHFAAPNAENTKVGIGTSNIPSGYMLAVAGDVVANLVKVELQGAWPDYVFGDEYDLMSLTELNEYIRKNKHLPGIPDAQTIEEQGIDLGEMNILLLKKVEELTLYAIDQEKRMKEQDVTLKDLIEHNKKILLKLQPQGE